MAAVSFGPPPPRPDAPMTSHLRHTLLSIRDVFATAGPFVVLTLALLVVAYWALDPAPPKRVVLATGSELGALSAKERKISVQVDEDMYLVTPEKWIGPSDWVNHSCNPNAGLRGQITLVAMRAIKSGEDVCFDYAMSDGNSYDEFDCLCGARACRGRVQGNDWQRPELWKKYAGYFSPHLHARIIKLQKTTERRQERAVQIGMPALAVR